MNPFATLNDCSLFREGDEVEVWYCKTEFFGLFSLGNTEDFNHRELPKTHVLLGTLAFDKNSTKEKMLERLFRDLQGEHWSPNGEANELIMKLGLYHTSMSVGDVVRFKTGEVYFCKPLGWDKY